MVWDVANRASSQCAPKIVLHNGALICAVYCKCIRERIYSQLPQLGHCVSALLDILKTYQYGAIKTTVLGALLALSGVSASPLLQLLGSVGSCLEEERFSLLRELVEFVGEDASGGEGGQVFASFLPGIAIGLCKLVTVDTKSGQETVSLALLVWAHFVCLVMTNNGNSNQQDRTEQNNSSQSPAESERSLLIEKTSVWYKETDKKLNILVQQMVSLISHDNWKVRLAMVAWGHSLLTHCQENLPECLPSLLEVLVTLSHDSYPQVAHSAGNTVAVVSQQYAKAGRGTLTAILEERLYSLASALPRLMRQHDDSRKLSTLQLLAGYLRLLGPHTISFVHSHSHLSRITQALIETFQLEVESVSIMEQLDISVDVATESYPLRLHYRHFRSEEVEALLQHVCQLLGFYGSLPVLLDHLLDLFRASSLHRKEVVLLITHVLTGASCQGCAQGLGKPPHAVSNADLFSLVEGLVQELTTPSVWNCKLDQFSSSPSSLPSAFSHEAALLSSLLLDALTVCVGVLGNQFDCLMQQTAYPFLQKLGEPSLYVSNRAASTLKAVCKHCGYRSLPQLISRNADYLVNSVALQLRSGPTHHPEAQQVMRAILSHGDEDVLALMSDSITELLLSLDLKDDPSLLWPSLLTLSTAAAKWAPHEVGQTQAERSKEDGTDKQNEDSCHSSLTPEAIRDFFLEYHREKEEKKWTELEDDGVTQEDEENSEDSSKKTLPPAHQAAHDVLQRCTHHLATPSPPLRITVLECLRHCLLALRHDHKTLLPLVHKVWPALLPRLSDSSAAVTLRAVEVVSVMCDVCGSFLRKRVMKCVWPPTIKSLESLSEQSAAADSLYRQTVDFKLQRKLLQSVGELCERLDLSPSDAEPIAQACIPYLSWEQPKELQAACKGSLGTLCQRDPDGMWLLLAQLQPAEAMVPPHPVLVPYKFSPISNSSLYAVNVSKLMLVLQRTSK